MSHGDRVLRLPEGFVVLGTSENSPFAAVRHAERPIWGVQFHPEVAHTAGGHARSSRTSRTGSAAAPDDWTMEAFIAEATARIRAQVGERRAVCGLSGGVDSSVAAALVHRGDRRPAHLRVRRQRPAARGRARGGRARCSASTSRSRSSRRAPRTASSTGSPGERDPERKRRIIGHTFIEVFEEEARKLARRRPRRGRVPRAGHALSRRDRERLGARAVGHDQDPSQRGRAARAHEPRARRAAARAVQGRGARGGPQARPARGAARPPPVPGARASRSA